MIMPSFTTLPESMLDGSGIAQKFGTQSLAGLRGLRGIYQGEGLSGLGCGCSEFDDSGNCLDPDPCVTGTTDTGGSSTPIVSDCAYGGTYPNCDPAPSTTVNTAQAAATFCSQNGLTYNTSTQLCNTPPAGTTLTSQQQAALNQQLANSGTQLAKILAAGATGVTVLPNGTIVGSAQTGSSLATLGTSLSNFMPLLLIAFLGIVALKAGK